MQRTTLPAHITLTAWLVPDTSLGMAMENSTRDPTSIADSI
ncbi:MAG TPA: hypothetical protein VKB58_17325 [Terriglobales bacterium]|nr:hypothetical protein [Terriglobales bacterium]